jgi:predicted outer membrane repeat protein
VTRAIALLICALLGGAAHAAGVVTLCAEDVQTGPPGALNLQTALAGGGRVTFNCPGFPDIHITRQHVLSASTLIDGGGTVTLDGFGATALFAANAGSPFSLVNITLRNGHARPVTPVPPGTSTIEPAGVVQSAGVVLLDNVTIDGAHLAVEADTLKITNSRFMDNDGDVLRATTIDIDNGVFTGNTGSPVTNRTQLGPGHPGITTLPKPIPGTLTIKGGRFESNLRPVTWTGTLTVHGTVFLSNGRATAAQSGGALSIWGNAVIEKAVFQRNTAGFGGAIAIGTGSLRLRRDVFEDNRATFDGGAIEASEAEGTPVPVTITYSRFEGNAATNGGAIAFHEGGARPGTLSAGTVTFIRNTASAGGGGLFAEGPVLLSRAIFTGNQAGIGGGFAVGQATLANAIVAHNQASAAAGGLGAQLSLINSTVADNVGPGLGLQPIAGAALTLKNTIVLNNSAGNCASPAAAIIDKGNNLQFPTADCGAGVAITDPKIDSWYVPYATSPVLNAGDDAACSAAPISARDIYGAHRPYLTHCAIGAVEGTLEQPALYVLRQTAQPPAPLGPLVQELNGAPPQGSPSGPPVSDTGSSSSGTAGGSPDSSHR